MHDYQSYGNNVHVTAPHFSDKNKIKNT